ncbi:MAG TPA: tryptophan-rich sensory protein [Alphaproteobacteria bacterium]|nr:tryptophan-rich sensory protein [Alphaproteobacteria bacterium]
MPSLRKKHSWLPPVLLFVGVCLLVNGIIFGLGWNAKNDDLLQPWFAPPGAFIGTVWVALFALMGASYAHLQHLPKQRCAVMGLAVLCLAYPFYTMGLQASVTGQVGTLITLVATAGLMGWVYRKDRAAALLLAPLGCWLVFASFLTASVLRLNGPVL